MSSGTITAIIDCGTIVQVFIDGRPYAADGNLWRGTPLGVGDEVAFESTGWGGLAWIGESE